MNKIDRKKYMKEIDFKHNFKEYWSFLSKYKVQFYVLLLIVFLMSATYVVDKYLFKELIDRGTEFASGILGREAFVGISMLLNQLKGAIIKSF